MADIQHPARRPLALLAVGLLGLMMSMPGAPASGVADSVTPMSGRASIAFIGPAMFRVDRQQPAVALVTVRGVDARHRATVDWGDGSVPESGRGPCSSAGASEYPTACALVLSHVYARPGVFSIRAWAGRASATRSLHVVEAPRRWTPPAGWRMPDDWRTFEDGTAGAVFTPCERIPWFFDDERVPADRTTMITDIETALAMLAERTGLRFIRTEDPVEAKVSFRWSDLDDAGVNVAAQARVTGWSHGEVLLSTTNDWTRDAWAGTAHRRLEWEEGQVRLWRENEGRVWLVVHEAMHVLGFDHVADPEQVMNPVAARSAWGSGDLAGLDAMYGSRGCPPIPD